MAISNTNEANKAAGTHQSTYLDVYDLDRLKKCIRLCFLTWTRFPGQKCNAKSHCQIGCVDATLVINCPARLFYLSELSMGIKLF